MSIQNRSAANHSEIKAGYLALALRVLFLTAIGVLLLTKVFLVTQVKGSEMFPAMKDGDLLVAYRLHRSYRKNDVVVYSCDGVRYTGRIAALARDVVTIDEDGILTVNGTEQRGEILYPTYPKGDLTYPYTVSDGAVFVLGDYRTMAYDSRERGELSLENVEGKVITLLRRRGL